MSNAFSAKVGLYELVILSNLVSAEYNEFVGLLRSKPLDGFVLFCLVFFVVEVVLFCYNQYKYWSSTS